MPGSNPTITLASSLPALASPVNIDGRTQPGYAGSPLVTISGALAPGNVNGITITSGAAGTQIIGLAIDDFTRGSGIVAAAAGVTLLRNTLANNLVGISLISASGGSVIGNTITGSLAWGLYATGNSAGTQVQGTVITGSRRGGVVLANALGLMFGGTSPGSSNLITRAPGHRRTRAATIGLMAVGNSKGTFVLGNSIKHNHGSGVWLRNATGITVGGRSPAARNKIFFNSDFGLRAIGGSKRSLAKGNTIRGNRIDLSVSSAR